MSIYSMHTRMRARAHTQQLAFYNTHTLYVTREYTVHVSLLYSNFALLTMMDLRNFNRMWKANCPCKIFYQHMTIPKHTKILGTTIQ